MKIGKHWQRQLSLGVVVGASLLLAGCGALLRPVADPTRFYVLESVEHEPVTEEIRAEQPMVVGLDRVRVARYLEDTGIAVREEGTRILYSQRYRWAEPIEHGLTRILVEQLGEEPAVARVVVSPDQRRPLPDLDLHISITRAEGVRSSGAAPYAVFRANWELRAGIDAEVVASGRVLEDQLPWDGEDFGQLVGSLSEGVARLTRSVARALDEL